MELEVLVSTMRLKSQKENKKLLNNMCVTGKSLTVSQTDEANKNYNIGENRLILDDGIGLSRSRNIALENAKADIIIFADDDVIYNKNYEEIIKEEYNKNPSADMIAFYVESLNPERKIRKLKRGKIGFIKTFRVASVELTFKLDSIKKNNLKFDENFGTGTKNFCGEETIFLNECLKKKMKLEYADRKIGVVKQEKSTWFNGINKEFLRVEKECFKKIAPKWWWILYIQFVIRKVILVKIKNALFM